MDTRVKMPIVGRNKGWGIVVVPAPEGMLSIRRVALSDDHAHMARGKG